MISKVSINSQKKNRTTTQLPKSPNPAIMIRYGAQLPVSPIATRACDVKLAAARDDPIADRAYHSYSPGIWRLYFQYCPQNMEKYQGSILSVSYWVCQQPCPWVIKSWPRATDQSCRHCRSRLSEYLDQDPISNRIWPNGYTPINSNILKACPCRVFIAKYQQATAHWARFKRSHR